MTDEAHRWRLDLDRIQDLARLELDVDQRERLEHDLRRILRFAAEMGETGAPVEDPIPSPQVELRRDETSELELRHWQKNAPALRDGWFVVPDRSHRS